MPRKGENIYKRKDGRWEARYIKERTSDGKAVYGYVYANSYQEVKLKQQQCFMRIVEQAKYGYIEEQKKTTLFCHLANEWKQSVAPKVKESTYNKYSNLLDAYIIPAIGRYPINSLTNDIIEDQSNKLLISGGRNRMGLSPKTVSDILSIIRCVLKYASKNGNPIICDAGSIQVRRHPKEMRVLSRCEQTSLCKYIYGNLNPYTIGILLSLFTGIRIGELCALRWEDISLQEQTIRIHQTLQRVQDKSNGLQKTKIVITVPKSASSIRTIPLPDNLVKILKNYKTVDSGYFLTNSLDRFIEPRTMQYRFKTVLKNSSVEPANFHSLRHTFATRCIELGFDVKSLSEILGHASVNITMNRYVHPSLELKKQNMQRLTELFAVN